MAQKSALGSDPFARKKRPAPPPPAAAAQPEAPAKSPSKKRTKTARKDPPPAEVQEVTGELAADELSAPLPGEPVDAPPFTPNQTSVPPSLHGVRGLWSNLRMRGIADEVDGFGFDPVYFEQVRGALEFLYARYWRVKLTGAENIPADGRVILVANHSGGFPYDALMLMYGLQKALGPSRTPRPLVEDDFWHVPFLGLRLARLGCVRANPENAERLLKSEHVVGVFPEGIKGLGKSYRERYQLQRFGRGGFVKLAVRTRSPVVPVAIVGAEEVHPMLGKLSWPASYIGLPYLPVTPTFPWLGLLGMLPLPTRWTIRIGAPIDLGGDDVDTEDMALINTLTEKVRADIQRMLDDGLASRRSVIFG